jgi:hypothetical protein
MDRAGALEAGEKLQDASRQAARRPELQRLARAGF